VRTSTSVSERMSRLFPQVGPWASAALWHGLVEMPVPSAPLEDELDLILQQRLTPLLVAYLAASEVRVSPGLLKRIHSDEFLWSVRTSSVMIHAEEILGLMARSDIDCVVSKGPGIAAHYPLAARPFSDLDLLVRPQAFSAARTVFLGAGYAEKRENRQPWPAFDRLCREGLNLESATGGSVDLHHHVPPWFWGQRLDIGTLIANKESLRFGDAQIPCLSCEANLLVAALHIISDRNRPGQTLLIWRDVAQLARVCNPAKVREIARTAGLEGWLGAILRALPAFAQPTDLMQTVGAPRITRGRYRLRLMLAEGGRYGVRATQPLRLPLPSAVLHEIGMAIPSPQFLRLRYPDPQHRYVTWWREGFFHTDDPATSSRRPWGSPAGTSGSL
jgi:hypothetical protein